MNEIIKKYPKIFKDYKGNPAGVNWDCPEGWLQLLDDLCGSIQSYIDNVTIGGEHPTQIECLQVKEKYGCYDAETEVLTKNGWKHFKNCNKKTEFATLNKEGNLEYQLPLDIISYRYNGKMYKLVARGVDLLVTPNHNLYVAKGNSFGKFKNRNTKKYPFKFYTPDILYRKPKRFLKSAKWKGEKIDKVIIPGYTYKNYMKLHDKERIYNKKDLVI